MLGCASWTGQAPLPDILGRCAAVDEKAAALLAERDQALLTATAALLVGFLTSQPMNPHCECIIYLLWLKVPLCSGNDLCLSESTTQVGFRTVLVASAPLCRLRIACPFQEYSAALQQTLPNDYTAGSQHAKWTAAFSASLAAHAQSLQAEGNMETIQVCFHSNVINYQMMLL